jgi:chromosome segregation ATPase
VEVCSQDISKLNAEVDLLREEVNIPRRKLQEVQKELRRLQKYKISLERTLKTASGAKEEGDLSGIFGEDYRKNTLIITKVSNEIILTNDQVAKIQTALHQVDHNIAVARLPLKIANAKLRNEDRKLAVLKETSRGLSSNVVHVQLQSLALFERSSISSPQKICVSECSSYVNLGRSFIGGANTCTPLCFSALIFELQDSLHYILKEEMVKIL